MADFTWAEATLEIGNGFHAGGRPLMRKGRTAVAVYTGDVRAHLDLTGSMMRFMGRFWMEASPVRVTEKFWAERMPEISRVVVPLLPQSSTTVRLL